MSYSQYWGWKTAIADAERFAAWSRDVARLHRYMATPGARLPREVPVFVRQGGKSDFDIVCSFLSHTVTHLQGDLEVGLRWGAVFVPEPIPFPPLIIRGPDGTGEPTFTPTEVAFNGDRDLIGSYKEFRITLDHLKAPHWEGIRTNLHFDILVRCAVVRLVHYFPPVCMFGDGGKHSMMIPVEICRYVFGDDNAYPLWSPVFDDEDE